MPRTLIPPKASLSRAGPRRTLKIIHAHAAGPYPAEGLPAHSTSRSHAAVLTRPQAPLPLKALHAPFRASRRETFPPRLPAAVPRPPHAARADLTCPAPPWPGPPCPALPPPAPPCPACRAPALSPLAGPRPAGPSPAAWTSRGSVQAGRDLIPCFFRPTPGPGASGPPRRPAPPAPASPPGSRRPTRRAYGFFFPFSCGRPRRRRPARRAGGGRLPNRALPPARGHAASRPRRQAGRARAK
jgi:hypothetical protein